MVEVDPLERTLRRSLAPYHKRALGMASGIVAALTVFALTVFHKVAAPPEAANIDLLAQYFYGYDVTWRGAFVGAAILGALVLALLLFQWPTQAELATQKHHDLPST